MLGAEKVRAALTGKVKDLAEQGIAKNEAEAWLADCNDSEKTRSVTDALVAALEKPEYSSISEVQDILKDREYLVKKSYWPSAETAGLMISLRRFGSCHRIQQKYQYFSTGYRSIFQHRRTVFQVHTGQRHRKICCSGQADKEERSGADGNELRLCLCGTGCHGI